MRIATIEQEIPTDVTCPHLEYRDRTRPSRRRIRSSRRHTRGGAVDPRAL